MGSPSVIRVDNKNWIEFLHFEGIQLDKKITLQRPARFISAVLCGGGGGPAMLVAAWLSFAPLGLAQDAASVPGLSALPFNLSAFPISSFQRAMAVGDNTAGDPNWPLDVAQAIPQHAKLKFRCPFTDFYLNCWGIDSTGAPTSQVTVTLICSDDIEDITTYPTPKLFQ